VAQASHLRCNCLPKQDLVHLQVQELVVGWDLRMASCRTVYQSVCWDILV
jgi:hypothetical protein